MKRDDFIDLRIVDNFYQTSSFYPMPVVLIGTINEDGITNLGPYSLCFPYYVAGKDYYAMLLETRNNSNTAVNLFRNPHCTVNFIPDKRRFMKQCVALGYPGDTTEEKMKDCIFTLKPGLRGRGASPGEYPMIVAESFQVYECIWDSSLENGAKWSSVYEFTPPYNNFNGVTSEFGAHFILKIEKILIAPRYGKQIISGVRRRGFPHVPVDYGYRDNMNFWFSRFRRPYREKIPKNKGVEVTTVYYAANRIDPEVEFTEEACEKLTKVPRIFLNTALKGCVEWAKENGIKELHPEHMDTIRNKRSGEK